MTEIRISKTYKCFGWFPWPPTDHRKTRD